MSARKREVTSEALGASLQRISRHMDISFLPVREKVAQIGGDAATRSVDESGQGSESGTGTLARAAPGWTPPPSGTCTPVPLGRLQAS